MKLARVTHLIRTFVEPEFTGYRQKGRLYHKTPVDRILRGYYFDQSRHPEILRLVAFVQPLYVPRNDMPFILTYRVWDNVVPEVDEADTMDDVVRRMKYYEKFLNLRAEPADLISGRSVFDPDYPINDGEYHREIRVYSQIAAGDYRGARDALISFRKFLKPHLEWTNPHPGQWLKDMDSRAAALEEALRANQDALRTFAAAE